MSVFSRTDQNIFAQWWWTVDRWMLLGVAVLLATGLLMVVAASPAVAQKHNLSMYIYLEHPFSLRNFSSRAL